MDFLARHAFRAPHGSADGAFSPLARFVLYLRGHWLRMPPWLLLPHLLRKVLRPS